MPHWMRFACCLLPAACGPVPMEGGVPAPVAPGSAAPERVAREPVASEPIAPAPVGGEACPESAAGTGYAHALLRLGCGGEVLPGRAAWSRDGDEVTLDFAEPTAGPAGAELVEAWPPLTEPPWLGHRIEAITVLPGGSVGVRFGGPPRGPGTEPERLFADRRLSGVPLAVREGDARDAIDAGQTVLTRHGASVEYARSLGRPVRMVAFDRLYMVVFAGGAGDAGDAGGAAAVELGRAVAADWVQWGAEGARRAAAFTWGELAGRCGASSLAGGVEGGQARPAPAEPTVSYREGDLPGLQLAERIVSAIMRRDRHGSTARALAGSAARPSVRAAGGARPGRAQSDVAAVLRVESGPGHPCSLHAEVLRALEAWGPMRAAGAATVLVGEAAVFEIGPPGPAMRRERAIQSESYHTKELYHSAKSCHAAGPPGWPQ